MLTHIGDPWDAIICVLALYTLFFVLLAGPPLLRYCVWRPAVQQIKRMTQRRREWMSGKRSRYHREV